MQAWGPKKARSQGPGARSWGGVGGYVTCGGGGYRAGSIMDHRCISHPRKKNQRMPARTKWTRAIPTRPCKSWPKPGMKKLHSAANTLLPDPGPAIGLSSRTEHVAEEHGRLYSKCWCDGRRM